jgi:hypothetical protein
MAHRRHNKRRKRRDGLIELCTGSITEQLAELYFVEGWNLTRVAKQTGLSMHTVWDRLTDAGFKLRPTGIVPFDQEKTNARMAYWVYRRADLCPWITLAQATFLRAQPCFYCGAGPSNSRRRHGRRRSPALVVFYQGTW